MKYWARDVPLYVALRPAQLRAFMVTVVDGHREETTNVDAAVLMEIENLRRASLEGLREKFREVFHEETRCRHREHLLRRIGYTGSAGGSETVVWDTNSLPGGSFTQNSWGRVAYRESNCAGFSPTYTCLEMFSYTPSGHVTAKELSVYNPSANTSLLSLQAGFTYDNEGRTTSISYPVNAFAPFTGGTYTYSFDALGRPSGVTQGASGALYNPADQLTQVTYGPGTEDRAYNSLNQLTSIHLGDAINMSYSYNAGSDNGQIAQSVDSAHGQSILYTYDSLRRASTAKASAIPYVQNQGFEQTVFSPWTTGGQEGSAFEITDVNPHSGTYAAQITNTSLQQSFTCSPNATYTFSGWARAASGNFLDIGMTLGTNGQTWQPGVSSGTWSQFSEQLTAPSSCSGVTISIAEGTYDDLSLTSTATGSTNLLSSLNPGFESGSQTNIWSLSGGARPSTVEAHAGASSLLIPAGGSATQTVTGCVPSSSYTVYAWYYGAGATASLQAGGGTSATGSANQWTLLSASGNSTGSGSLTITLSATGTGSVYFDDLSLSTVNPATPTLTWGQQFGYDGFGTF
jgi:hypothetical protein